MNDLLLLFLIRAAFVGAALIRRGRLLEGSAYKILECGTYLRPGANYRKYCIQII